jgi:hypothetical protein
MHIMQAPGIRGIRRDRRGELVPIVSVDGVLETKAGERQIANVFVPRQALAIVVEPKRSIASRPACVLPLSFAWQRIELVVAYDLVAPFSASQPLAKPHAIIPADVDNRMVHILLYRFIPTSVPGDKLGTSYSPFAKSESSTSPFVALRVGSVCLLIIMIER